MYKYLALAVLLCTLLIPVPAPAAAADTSQLASGNSFRYFPETGHSIGLSVKRFYESNGAEAVFGLPLTDVFIENGVQVQYFERARFEILPQPGGTRLNLSLLGRMLTAGREGEQPFFWLPGDPGDGATFFAESGHTLRGAFREFWNRNGGVAVFGYPISEEFREISPVDGLPYTVQYFERARFEYHDALQGTPGEIQLAPLGRMLLEQRPELQQFSMPGRPIELIGSATTGFRASSFERRTNVIQAAAMFEDLVVLPGQEHSFLSAGDFSEAAGFVEGYGIVGGKLDRVIGGGVCQVSTTLFRAVSNAGMGITNRVAHTYIVNFYDDIVGFDATVYSPQVDFRWRNTSPYPVTITSFVNAARGTVTFEVWGISDGRTVRYEGPFTRNKIAQGDPIWEYDPTLPKGVVRQLVHGRPGMDVTYTRIITQADGTQVRNTYTTRYRPWADFYVYGPGVTPGG